MVKIVTVIVRKTAHFSEYFILGLLSCLTAFTYKKFSYKMMSFISFGFCVLYAASDEIHQYFVPGRACRFIDICIDAAGSAVAIIVLAVIFNFKKRHKSGELNAKKETD